MLDQIDSEDLCVYKFDIINCLAVWFDCCPAITIRIPWPLLDVTSCFRSAAAMHSHAAEGTWYDGVTLDQPYSFQVLHLQICRLRELRIAKRSIKRRLGKLRNDVFSRSCSKRASFKSFEESWVIVIGHWAAKILHDFAWQWNFESSWLKMSLPLEENLIKRGVDRAIKACASRTFATSQSFSIRLSRGTIYISRCIAVTRLLKDCPNSQDRLRPQLVECQWYDTLFVFSPQDGVSGRNAWGSSERAAGWTRAKATGAVACLPLGFDKA